MRTPPTLAEPADTVSTSVPRLDTRCSIDALAPSPSAIMTMTAATPMITPSEVNAERSLFRVIASNASAIVLVNFMAAIVPRYPAAAASAARAASRPPPALLQQRHPIGPLRSQSMRLRSAGRWRSRSVCRQTHPHGRESDAGAHPPTAKPQGASRQFLRFLPFLRLLKLWPGTPSEPVRSA